METLETVCQNQSFLKTKIALISFYNTRYPQWFEKVLLILEYLQLISQALLLQSRTFEYPEKTDNFFFDAVLYFFKLINPSYLLLFKEESSAVSVILLIVFGLTILKYLLFGYIVCIASCEVPRIQFLISIWKYIFKMQSRIICFFVTSFWAQTILGYSKGDFSLYGLNETVAVGICLFLIAIEYIFSFILEIQFCYVLPTKDFLSSKSYRSQVATLSQKLLLEILRLTLKSDSQINLWAFSSVNLFISTVKQYMFYYAMPLYNLKALFYQASLLSLVTSLNIACFVQTLLVEVDYQANTANTVIVLWIILAILIAKMYHYWIQNKIVGLLTDKEAQYPPHMIVHKITASNQLNKLKKMPGERLVKYDFNYLISLTENIYPSSMLIAKSEASIKDEGQKNFKAKMNEAFMEYLENFSTRFPRDSFLKVFLARLYSKSPTHCNKAIKIISELKRKNWSKSYLSAQLLLYKVQKTLRVNNQMNKEGLDLSRYITCQIVIERLKKAMLVETDLKITISHNILSEISNIGKIHACAQLIDKSKTKIDKKISHLSRDIPDSYTEPLLLSAGYHLVLNYSLDTFKKFSDMWTHKQAKYSRSFKEHTLNNENLYQDNNAFLVLSGEKHTNGQIVYCSSSTRDTCGGQRISYNGSHISTLFTSSFRPFYAALIKQITETGQYDILKNVERAYIKHKDGHIVEAELFLRIHPYLTRGLYLNMVLRPIPTPLEYILVKENGDIEGATKRICRILGMKTSSRSSSITINVSTLSKELSIANEAFNIVHKFQKNEDANLISNLDLSLSIKKRKSNKEEAPIHVDAEQALELHRMYNSEGRTLELLLGKSGKDSVFLFHCHISMIPYGSNLMKVIRLDEKENGSQKEIHKTMDMRDTKMSEINNEREDDFPSNRYLITQKLSPLASENLDFSGVDENINFETNNIKTEANLLFSNRLEVPGSPNERKQLIKPSIVSAAIIEQPQSESHKEQRIENLLKSVQESQSSHDQKRQKMFRRTIETKTYPGSFKPLCLSFYIVILIALAGQVILKVISDSTLKDLVLKKNLLNFSQLRSYKADLILINYIGYIAELYDPMQTVLKQAGQNIWPLGAIIANANSHEKEFKNYNSMIANNITSLDEKVKQQLLAKDVRVFGTFADVYSDDNVSGTIFDSVNMMINAMHELTHLSNVNSTAGFDLSHFVARNIMNDFLYKSSETTNIFVNSVKEERGNLQSIISIMLTITPLMLSSIALMLVIIIYNQYSITRQQLLAFITIDEHQIREILASFKGFRDILTGEKVSEDKQSVDYFQKIAISTRGRHERNYRKQNEERRIKDAEIKRKYYGYFFKVIFYILILIGVMIWNYITAQQSVDVIYRRQSQLEFASHISEVVSTTYLAITCMPFFYFKEFPMKRVTPLEVAITGLAEVKVIRSQMLEMFKELDGTYDPRVKALLLEHRTCKQINFTVSSAKAYCTYQEQAGQLLDLVSLMTVFESVTYDRILAWNTTCNKTDMSGMILCAFWQYNLYLQTFGLAAVEAQMIGDIVGANLEESVAEAYSQRNLLLIIFSVSLIIVGVLTWFQILKWLREIHNEFKKVLRVFPPIFILSNFLVKTFLQQTSRRLMTFTQ